MNNTRKISLLSALALVINFQLGSGFFVSPGQIAPMGRWGLLGWLVSGLGALALCHVFAALSFWNDEEGGPHVYVEGAFGKKAAFYVAWSYWIVGWVSSLPLVWLAATSLQDVLGSFGEGQGLLFSLLVIVFAAVMNVQGVTFSGISEVFFSVIKIFPMIIVPLACWSFVQKNPLTLSSDFPPIASLGHATLSTFWGFLGIEAGTTVIQSVKNPRRSIPRALFGGTLAVLMIYFFGSSVVMSILPKEVLVHSTNAYTALLSHVFGYGWARIMSFVVFIVCATTVNSWLLVSGQVGFMAAKKGLFPTFFEGTNARGAPVTGVLITSTALGAAVLLAARSTIQEQLGKFVDFSVGLFILTYLVSVLSLVHLIQKKKIRSYPALWCSIGISAFFCVWVLSSMEWVSFVVMLSISVLGGLLARFLRWPIY
jgi:APA family basic amino acid/polyamine antiporter